MLTLPTSLLARNQSDDSPESIQLGVQLCAIVIALSADGSHAFSEVDGGFQEAKAQQVQMIDADVQGVRSMLMFMYMSKVEEDADLAEVHCFHCRVDDILRIFGISNPPVSWSE